MKKLKRKTFPYGKLIGVGDCAEVRYITKPEKMIDITAITARDILNLRRRFTWLVDSLSLTNKRRTQQKYSGSSEIK